jgi:hypothetical protein
VSEFFGRDDELARWRTRYALEEPRLRAAWAESVDAFARLVADALARAAGRRADELEVEVIASSLLWALAAAVRRWHAGGYVTPLEEELEHAFAVLERGLRLDAPVRPPR